MKSTFLSILFSISCLYVSGQASDLQFVKHAVSDPARSIELKIMAERFHQKADTGRNAVALLYYGNLFDPAFDSLSMAKAGKELLSLFRQRDFNRIIDQGEALLAKHPANLEVLMAVNTAYVATGDTQNYKRTEAKVMAVKHTILSYGDGSTPSRAIKLCRAEDRPLITQLLRMQAASKHDMPGNTNPTLEAWNMVSMDRKQSVMYFELLTPERK